jgi:hypothetical protein
VQHGHTEKLLSDRLVFQEKVTGMGVDVQLTPEDLGNTLPQAGGNRSASLQILDLETLPTPSRRGMEEGRMKHEF